MDDDSDTPEQEKIFAIGDIHGCATELKVLLDRLPLTPQTTVVFLGDYIDRGEQSREVIDIILALARECEVVTLMGNHESMLMDYLHDPLSPQAGMFIYNGGGATLASYADEQGRVEIPEEHLRFFRDLALSYKTTDYYFVHAGVPDLPLESLDEHQYRSHLLWVRKAFLQSQFRWSRKVIHGHSPVKAVEHKPNRINLDTGCVYNNKLSALALPEMRVYEVAKQTRTRPMYLREHNSRRRAIRFEGAIPLYIDRGAERLNLETLNYNELGVYVRDISNRVDRRALDRHEVVTGEIGADSVGAVRFKGKVLRRTRHADGIYYAIRFLTPVEEELELGP
jgi:serine/threonine protein phosphatase 1